MYKLTLPPNCPLGGAEERDVALYRILHGSTLTDDDLLSYFELSPDRYAGHCIAHGISLFKEREHAVRVCKDAIAKNHRLGAFVAKVFVKPDHGRLFAGKNGHYTLWLYDQVDVSRFKCGELVKVEV